MTLDQIFFAVFGAVFFLAFGTALLSAVRPTMGAAITFLTAIALSMPAATLVGPVAGICVLVLLALAVLYGWSYRATRRLQRHTDDQEAAESR